MMDLSLLQDFIAETGEHLEEMEANLLKLETDSSDLEVLNDIFRSAHTIKGSAEYLGMERIAELSHKLENLLEILRHGEHSLDKEIINTLIDSKDRITMLTDDLERSQTEKTEIKDLVLRIDQLNVKSSLVDSEFQDDDLISEDDESLVWNEDDSSAKETGYPTQTCEEIDIAEMQRYYDKLKLALYEMTRGNVDEKSKNQVLDLLNEFIKMSECMGNKVLTKNLNTLKNQGMTLSFPDDATDMLADLHRVMASFLPPSQTIDAEIESLSNETIEDAAEFDEPSVVSLYEDEQDIESLSFDESEEESYEEEYDDELFDIFIKHLKDNLSLLKTQVNEFQDSPNKTDMLNMFIEKVDGLHSSANYMDYKKLTHIYEKWVKEIKKAQEQISNGDVISFISPAGTHSNIVAGMNAYINELVKRFHKFIGAEFEEEPQVEETFQKEEELLSLDESEFDTEALASLQDFELESEKVEEADLGEKAIQEDYLSADQILNELDESEFLSEQILDEDEVIEESHVSPAQKSGDKDIAAVFDDTPKGFDYQGLFDELDDAFDSDPPPPAPPESEPELYHEEVEEKLANGDAHVQIKKEGHPAPKPSAPKIEVPVSETAPPQPVVEDIEVEAIESEDTESVSVPHLEERIPVKQTLRVDARKIDSLMNQVGELVVSRAWFSQLYSEMRELQMYLQETVRLDQREMKPVKALTFRISEATVALGRVANELQEGVMKVRMLPIAQLFNRYPRLVRDLTHNTNKKVRLEIVGEETELDKMIIEEVSDPLIHIIRNAVDHGCESVEERRVAGKPMECTLKLESYHESNHVVIEISDDGRGIDQELIKKRALEKKLFSPEDIDRLSFKDIMGIIMKPGFSTAKEVSKTSGRGVGMDVVKKNIEKLNGTIEIDSKKGVGTRFRIKIPLTLAIIRALLVRVGNDIFTIPLSAVEETLRVIEDDISIIEGVEVIHLRDSTLSLLRLSEIFSIDSKAKELEKLFVVVVNTGMRQVGLVVDALIGQEEAVIKPLVDYLQENSGFSGATILGDGRISLILDVYELVNMSIGKQIKRKNEAAAQWRRSENNDYSEHPYEHGMAVH